MKKLILKIAILLLSISILEAQWKQINGLSGVSIENISAIDDVYIAKICKKVKNESTWWHFSKPTYTYESEVLISTNSGKSWGYLSDSNLAKLNIADIVTFKNTFVISTHSDGIFISRDLGKTFIKSNNKLPEVNINKILISENSIYVVARNEIYESNIDCTSWKKSKLKIMPNNLKLNLNINCFKVIFNKVVEDGTLYIKTSEEEMNGTFENLYSESTFRKLFLNQNTYKIAIPILKLNSSEAIIPNFDNVYFYNSNIYSFYGNKLFTTTNFKIWKKINISNLASKISAIFINENSIYLGTENAGIFKADINYVALK